LIRLLQRREKRLTDVLGEEDRQIKELMGGEQIRGERIIIGTPRGGGEMIGIAKKRRKQLLEIGTEERV